MWVCCVVIPVISLSIGHAPLNPQVMQRPVYKIESTLSIEVRDSVVNLAMSTQVNNCLNHSRNVSKQEWSAITLMITDACPFSGVGFRGVVLRTQIPPHSADRPVSVRFDAAQFPSRRPPLGGCLQWDGRLSLPDHLPDT